MVIQKDKNTVDDYYSNLSSSPEDKAKKKVNIKKKIKIKPKKILVKKKTSEDIIVVEEPIKREEKKINFKKKTIISLEELKRKILVEKKIKEKIGSTRDKTSE